MGDAWLSLGYEHYDARLCRPGQSLVGAVTSVDGHDYGALGRLRLPRPGLFHCVRFTSRFTEQAFRVSRGFRHDEVIGERL